ncbi:MULTISPECIES: hypothetical protein [unclassified Aureimonas]|uniref:hypothetical protein n=1 Tax=unclassified Aureimonas TaxID=2615206 RepID=UPI0006F6C7D4|nr:MULTISPECIES: hypothetical protein [unclassified Aureimonas]KQT61197.1 hypothetical protein ASG62_24130 [Aureimonas sp. Leaf427]KQT62966.1 hypothetical protein ASG54_23075 [Aureimonas sp. Leaf460]
MTVFVTQKQKLVDAVVASGWVSTADLTDLLYSHRWGGGPDEPWVVIKTLLATARSEGHQIRGESRFYLQSRLDPSRFQCEALFRVYETLRSGPVSTADLMVLTGRDADGARARITQLRDKGARILRVSGYRDFSRVIPGHVPKPATVTMERAA